MNDEVGVAQPAVAVVPVAARVPGLGDRGRERGDDGASLLEVAELERDRRADHGVLPLEGDRERARPLGPVALGALAEVARRRGDRAGERLVGAEDEAAGARARTASPRRRRSSAGPS